MSSLCRSIAVLSMGVVILGASLIPAAAEDFVTMEKTHKYMGYSAVALALATAATNGDIDTHEPLAYATAGFALSTLLTGAFAHHERYDTSDGFFTKDNMHIMAGTLGAILLTAAVFIADDSYEEDADGESVDGGHAGLGVAGGILMTLAVIDIKW